MDFYIHRAMQIACMSDSQISAIHAREKQRGYCIPNWNIQELFNLPEIKVFHSIPDEASAMANHSARIKGELLMAKTGDVVEGEKPWDSVTISKIENVHKADWNVYNAKESGQINFLYQGASGNKRGGLRSRILSGVEAASGGD